MKSILFCCCKESKVLLQKEVWPWSQLLDRRVLAGLGAWLSRYSESDKGGVCGGVSGPAEGWNESQLNKDWTLRLG